MNNHIKRNKTWFILGIALVVGAIAAFGARSYLSAQTEAIEARGKGSTVKVIVAKSALKRGDRISTETVAVRAVPVDYAHSTAISPETFDRVDGQALAFPVRAGEMILWSLIEGKRAPTFSARVEVGHRAMTVPVDEISSISGLLEPGDLIDLLVTVDQKGRKITRPLLQNVQVMATGQRAVDSPRDGERRQYSTVTINITPAQAQHVILARDAGKVTALLRNPDDKNRVAGGNANMHELLAGAAKGTVGDTGIPVLYGGNKTLTPESLAMGRGASRPAPGSRAATALDAADEAAPEEPVSTVPVLSGGPARKPAPSAAGDTRR